MGQPFGKASRRNLITDEITTQMGVFQQLILRGHADVIEENGGKVPSGAVMDGVFDIDHLLQRLKNIPRHHGIFDMPHDLTVFHIQTGTKTD